MKNMFALGLLVIGILVSGCSKSPKIEMLKTANERGFCVQNELSTSEIAKLSQEAFGENVVFDASPCKDYIIDFKQRTCFHSLDELQKYIDSATNYKMLINSQNIKGIEIADVTVYSVIDYLNSRGNKKEIVFVDGDMKLENNYGKYIKTMVDLKDYVAKTTPLYFKRLYNTPEKTVYALRYKSTGKKINDTRGIFASLNEAKILTLKIDDMSASKKQKITQKLDEMMNGVLNESNN